MTSSAASDTLSARNTGSRSRGDGEAAAVGHVDVEKHDVGARGVDTRDRLGDGPGVADDVHLAGQFGADTGAEDGMIVDEEHLHHAVQDTGSR